MVSQRARLAAIALVGSLGSPGCAQFLGLDAPSGEGSSGPAVDGGLIPTPPPDAQAFPMGDGGGLQGLCAPAPQFGAPTNYGAGQMPSAVAVGDLDHTGARDVVVASRMTSSLTLYHGQPGGGLTGQELLPFTLPAECPPGSGAETVGVGDFDGDGFADLIYSIMGCPRQVVRRQNPAMPGKFLAEQVLPVTQGGRFLFDIGDLDVDGRDDVVVATDAELQVRFGRSDVPGTFLAGFTDATIDGSVTPVIADLNHDGVLDIAWMGDFGLRYSLQSSSTPRQFAAPVTLSSGANRGFAVGDLNGDAVNDILVSAGINAQIFTQNPTTHAFIGGLSFEFAGDRNMAIVDLNKDGRNDIHWDNEVELQCAAPAAAGTFSTDPQAPRVSIIEMVEATVFEDVNNDGKVDALGLSITDGFLKVALQQ